MKPSCRGVCWCQLASWTWSLCKFAFTALYPFAFRSEPKHDFTNFIDIKSHFNATLGPPLPLKIILNFYRHLLWVTRSDRVIIPDSLSGGLWINPAWVWREALELSFCPGKKSCVHVCEPSVQPSWQPDVKNDSNSRADDLTWTAQILLQIDLLRSFISLKTRLSHMFHVHSIGLLILYLLIISIFCIQIF